MNLQGQNAGFRLRHYRVAGRLQVGELATRLDVSRASYFRYENGEIYKLETVVKIAALLGLTFEQTIAPVSAAALAVMQREFIAATLSERAWGAYCRLDPTEAGGGVVDEGLIPDTGRELTAAEAAAYDAMLEREEASA